MDRQEHGDVGAVLAAAAAVPVTDAERRRETGELLVHMLGHGRGGQRVAVARAIVDLAPEQRAAAVAGLLGFVAEPASDPLVVANAAVWSQVPGWVGLSSRIALAVLDPAQAGSARAAARACDIVSLGQLAEEFAGLGPEECDLVGKRLADAVAGGTNPGCLAACLLSLGPTQHRRTREALDGVIARGTPIGLLARPLTDLHPDFVPHAVELALASLPLDPKQYLARQQDPDPQDIASAVLAAGEEYRDQVGSALWRLVRDPSAKPSYRRQAAGRLELVDRAAREQAERFLRDAVVSDPAAGDPHPVPTPQRAAEIRAAVADAWRRIDGWLHEHAPAVSAGLGGPASPDEITAVERDLGLALPVDFAASCAVHRSVEVSGVFSYVCHGDIGELAKWRDELAEEGSSGSTDPDDEIRRDQEWRRGWVPLDHEPDGSSVILDLDPGPEGDVGQLIYADQGSIDDVRARSWLDVLLDFAGELDADRYTYDPAESALRYRAGHRTR
ncbi:MULTISPECIES: SMI1/KNR4 family protein [Streptacidiphilus]|uniref:SMI1/KNR4 family protein n=1 Tax=Streptacidiphilus cavernicola TaxID=3342716 RepID=A0ABV6UM65_9ACTN|nr:SMI1/KNR4 family protein [Streptacidiphilus jeojiense]